jgi:hypothetical protein
LFEKGSGRIRYDLSAISDLRLTRLWPPMAAELCILLFNTSAGAQTVVATVPATSDANIWTDTPSESDVVDKIRDFAAEYLLCISVN